MASCWRGLRNKLCTTSTATPEDAEPGTLQKMQTPPLEEATAEKVQEIIDENGFGLYQFIALLCTGGVMFAEGSEVLVMGSVTSLLQEAWGLGAFIRGFMVSIVFVGFAVGNLISGKLGDSFGRRTPILISYWLIGVGGILTSWTWNAFTMVSMRWLVGVGCGIGFPAIYSFIPEVAPKHMRGMLSSIMIGFMPMGEVFAAICVQLIDAELEGEHASKESWRLLHRFGAYPAFVFMAFSYVFLYESPHYLRSQGRINELNEVLSTMARWNGKPEKCLRPESSLSDQGKPQAASDFSWLSAVATCLNSSYGTTTLVLFLAHYTKDLSVFGLNYVFPQYFKMSAGSMMSTGARIMSCSFLALPGVLIAVFVTRSKSVGHITSLSSAAAACGIMCIGLQDFMPLGVSLTAAYCVKFLAMANFIITVVYTAEVFPTVMRNTAVGLCTCFGRLGSISAPLIIELGYERTGSFNIYWSLLTSCMLTTAFAARTFLTFETKGIVLASHVEEQKALASSSAAVGDYKSTG